MGIPSVGLQTTKRRNAFSTSSFHAGRILQRPLVIFSGLVQMFKRALQTNHWMAIGLDKWNEIENMEITPELIRKMRKLKHRGSDSEGSDEEIETESEACEIEQLAEQESDGASEQSEVESEASAESEESDEEPAKSAFSFCPICPDKKFLTEADQEDHMKSAKHLKRESQLNHTPEVVTPAAKAKKEKKPVNKDVTTNNRKARRAHLATQKPNQ